MPEIPRSYKQPRSQKSLFISSHPFQFQVVSCITLLMFFAITNPLLDNVPCKMSLTKMQQSRLGLWIYLNLHHYVISMHFTGCNIQPFRLFCFYLKTRREETERTNIKYARKVPISGCLCFLCLLILWVDILTW